MTLLERVFVYGAVWAPNGRSVALRRKDFPTVGSTTPSELVLLDPDASTDVVLTADPIPALDGITERYGDGPSWSPDGREIAFAVIDAAARWQIWTIARSGGQLRRLLPELDASHFYPSWSPIDANLLAYVSNGIDGSHDLWLVRLDGAVEARNLTRGSLAGIEAPRWSPDAAYIAVSATRVIGEEPGSNERSIHLIDVESSTITRITRDTSQELQPVWSPDGSSLLVTSTRSSADAGGDRQNLWQVPLADMATPTRLTDTNSNTIGSDWYALEKCGESSVAEPL